MTFNRLRVLIPVLLCLFFLTLFTSASSGDRHPSFQSCLKACQTARCPSSNLREPIPFSESPILWLLRWTCTDDCAYRCTHSFTTNITPTEGFHQFYGKWPFWRFFGCQEPASVLFSIGNGWTHYQGLKKIQKRVNERCGLKKWMMALAVVQINTWFWSAVFHTRDTPLTEKLDYFSASLTIMFTLHFTLLRSFHLFAQPPHRSRGSPYRPYLSAFFVIMYICHISYLLSTPRFNYSYNVAFNTMLGAIHLTMWACYSASFSTRLPFPFSLIPTPYPPLDPLTISPKPRFRIQTTALVLGTTLAMSLELFDFPPLLRVIDAHSLWHCATIFIARGWYDFMIKDAAMLEVADGSYTHPFPLTNGHGKGVEMEKTNLS